MWRGHRASDGIYSGARCVHSGARCVHSGAHFGANGRADHPGAHCHSNGRTDHPGAYCHSNWRTDHPGAHCGSNGRTDHPSAHCVHIGAHCVHIGAHCSDEGAGHHFSDAGGSSGYGNRRVRRRLRHIPAGAGRYHGGTSCSDRRSRLRSTCATLPCSHPAFAAGCPAKCGTCPTASPTTMPPVPLCNGVPDHGHYHGGASCNDWCSRLRHIFADADSYHSGANCSNRCSCLRHIFADAGSYHSG
eukprot:gene48255-35638_t